MRIFVVIVFVIDWDNDWLIYNFRIMYRNFVLDFNSGEIFFISFLDREIEDVYEFYVLVFDGGR